MFFNKRNETLPMPETALLITVHDPVTSTIVRDLLEQSEIPCLSRSAMTFDPMAVLANSNALGEDIFVPADRLEEARALVHAFTSGEYAHENETADDEAGAREDTPCE